MLPSLLYALVFHLDVVMEDRRYGDSTGLRAARLELLAVLRVRVHEDYGYTGFFWDVALTTDRLIDLWLAGEATPFIPMKRYGNLTQLWGPDDQDINSTLAGVKKFDSYRNSPYIETENWCLSVLRHGKWQRYFFNNYIKS